MKVNLTPWDYALNGVLAIGEGILFYFKASSYLVGGLVAVFMFGYLVLSEVLEAYLGAKRQVKILDSKAFMYLRLNGFRKITQEGTIGLLGEYNLCSPSRRGCGVLALSDATMTVYVRAMNRFYVVIIACHRLLAVVASAFEPLATALHSAKLLISVNPSTSKKAT